MATACFRADWHRLIRGGTLFGVGGVRGLILHWHIFWAMEDFDEETGVQSAVCITFRDDRNRGDIRLPDASPWAEKQ